MRQSAPRGRPRTYLNGVIEYDLDAGTEVAHHGLALSGDGTRLRDVGTIDNTVSIVDTASMTATSTVDVGLVPYWATTSPDGQSCFVTVSGQDRIAAVPESELPLLSPTPG